MAKYIIKKLDENFDVCKQVATYTDKNQALSGLKAIKGNDDYVLIEIDNDGEEHLVAFR